MGYSGRGLAAVVRGPWWQTWRTVGDDRLTDISCKLMALCLGYVLVAALIWPVAYGDMLRIYLVQLVVMGPMALLFILAPVAIVASPRSPMRFIVGQMRSNARRAGVVALIFVLSLAAYTTYKINIPKIVPFYGDKALADLGELLHGSAPWRIVHAIDSDALAWLVDITYSKIWFLEWFGMVLYAALYANKALHLRYLVALALTTIVSGTLLATLFSSAGPVFYDQLYNDTRYADLLAALRQRPYNEHVLYYSDYLMRSYLTGTPALGSGISAMPSMHVAIATLNAFYLLRLNRWLGVVGWAFALFIFFGSVYTGWHYAVDGYVAMLVVAVIWQRSGSFFENRRDRPGSPAQGPLPSQAHVQA